MSIKKGDVCPNENDPRWSILLSTVNNDKQDAVEAWTRNDYEFPEGWKLQSTKGWYEEARELRKKSVEELAEFIVSHTKESFSQKKISNSYWMKEFGDLGRATQKINKVNLQVRKELFKLHPIPGKYHKKSGNQMRILKTTDGRSIFKQVDYTLKPVDTLMSDRAVQMFSKAQKVGWTLDKTLNELGGFANYKQLFKQDQLNDKISDNTREQIITELASNYSYTVEINTAKNPKVGEKYIDIEYGYELEVTEETLQNQIRDGYVSPELNTQYYSNLTVPGGTNYTENEIATPLITPSIKGHAQFATDNGIGWFRSDDKEKKVVGWKEEDDFLNSETAQYNPISKNDKIVFGHPGIGKTYLKENGKVDVIDFDSDYKTKINEKFNLPKGFKARNDFQKSNKEEYQKAVRELWIEAKQEAKRTGKQLFASDMILLREFANDFDKVITMSKDTFVNRAKQRNDYTEGETEKWKTSLDTEISKINKSKVINTDKYLSDLLEGNPKTRRILEVQSDIFQKSRDIKSPDEIINELKKSGELQIKCD